MAHARTPPTMTFHPIAVALTTLKSQLCHTKECGCGLVLPLNRCRPAVQRSRVGDSKPRGTLQHKPSIVVVRSRSFLLPRLAECYSVLIGRACRRLSAVMQANNSYCRKAVGPANVRQTYQPVCELKILSAKKIREISHLEFVLWLITR